MNEHTVRFFHKLLPIRGDAKMVKFDDGDYRFWEVRSAEGETLLTFREMVGVVTIQERIDYWLRKEANVMPAAGIAMIWADHIVPASMERVQVWADEHWKQMKGFDLVKAYAALK